MNQLESTHAVLTHHYFEFSLSALPRPPTPPPRVLVKMDSLPFQHFAVHREDEPETRRRHDSRSMDSPSQSGSEGQQDELDVIGEFTSTILLPPGDTYHSVAHGEETREVLVPADSVAIDTTRSKVRRIRKSTASRDNGNGQRVVSSLSAPGTSNALLQWYNKKKNKALYPWMSRRRGVRRTVSNDAPQPPRKRLGDYRQYSPPLSSIAVPSSSSPLLGSACGVELHGEGGSGGREPSSEAPLAVVKCVLCDQSFRDAVKLVLHMNSSIHRLQVDARDKLGLPVTSELSCIAIVPIAGPASPGFLSTRLSDPSPQQAHSGLGYSSFLSEQPSSFLPEEEKDVRESIRPRYDLTTPAYKEQQMYAQYGFRNAREEEFEEREHDYAAASDHPRVNMDYEGPQSPRHYGRHHSPPPPMRGDLRELVSSHTSHTSSSSSPRSTYHSSSSLKHGPPLPSSDKPYQPPPQGAYEGRHKRLSPPPPLVLPPRQEPGAWREVQRHRLTHQQRRRRRRRSPSPISPSQPSTTPSPVWLFCELCDCKIGGLVNLNQHIGGRRHQTSLASAAELLQQQLGEGERCEVSEVFRVSSLRTQHWEEVAHLIRKAIRLKPFTFQCPLCSYEDANFEVLVIHMCSREHWEKLKSNPQAENILILEKGDKFTR